MTRTQRVVLSTGVAVTMATGYAVWQWWPILICCKVDGTDCYPVDSASDCPVAGRFVSECTCPTTLPDGTTDCRC